MNTLRYTLVAFLVVAVAAVAGAQTTYTSTASGNWSTMTWSPSGTPGASDNVVIADGHTVTINQNVSIANLTVGGGTSGTLTFEATTARVVTVSGNVTVAAGGTFIAQTPITTTGDLAVTSTSIANVASTTGVVAGMNIGTLTGLATGTTVASFTANTITLSLASTNTVALTGAILHIGYDDTLFVGGNLTNNGTFDMSRGNTAGICHVTFTKAGDQTISGAGATTRFRSITLNKVAAANKVISSVNVSAAGTPLAFVAGTWEQNAGRFTATSGTIGVGSASATSCGLNIIGSGSFSVFSNLNIFGSLLVNTTDSLIVGVGTTTGKIDLTNIIGASATFTKGTVVIYGKLATAAVTATTFNGANIIIDPKGFATAVTPGTDYSFRSTTGTGGTNPLTFTSGTITILNPNSTTSANPELAASSSVAPNISGTATFVLGQGANTVASAAGFRLNLNVAAALNNLMINTGTVGVALLANVTVKGKLTITSSGPLSGAFTWTAPNYVFNGNVAQVTGSIMPATVKNVTINNPAGVTSSQALAIDTLFLVSGTLTGPYTASYIISGSTAVERSSNEIPTEYALSQNYPNPFNPSTRISFALARKGNVGLKIYNLLGKEVAVLANGEYEAGTYDVTWNAEGFTSGTYFLILRSGDYVQTNKMVLMK
jgi:hypothetical protein